MSLVRTVIVLLLFAGTPLQGYAAGTLGHGCAERQDATEAGMHGDDVHDHAAHAGHPQTDAGAAERCTCGDNGECGADCQQGCAGGAAPLPARGTTAVPAAGTHRCAPVTALTTAPPEELLRPPRFRSV